MRHIDNDETTVKDLYASELLTKNEARNGRTVLWYLDSTVENGFEIAIYADTLEELSPQEIEGQLM